MVGPETEVNGINAQDVQRGEVVVVWVAEMRPISVERFGALHLRDGSLVHVTHDLLHLSLNYLHTVARRHHAARAVAHQRAGRRHRVEGTREV